MIYAIDTNIIYDILLADPEFGPSSRDFVAGLYADGHSLVACDVVWAEASAGFADKSAFRHQMAAFGIDFSPMPEAATIRPGKAVHIDIRLIADDLECVPRTRRLLEKREVRGKRRVPSFNLHGRNCTIISSRASSTIPQSIAE